MILDPKHLPLEGSKPIQPYRLSACIDPSLIPAVSEALRRAGLIDVVVCPESVHWSIFANSPAHASQRSQALLLSINGTDFGLWADLYSSQATVQG